MMPDLTLSTRTETDDLDRATKLVREALGALDHAERLLRKAAEIHSHYTGRWAIVADTIADISPSERVATEALLIEGAAEACGERVRYPLVTEGGAGL